MTNTVIKESQEVQEIEIIETEIRKELSLSGGLMPTTGLNPIAPKWMTTEDVVKTEQEIDSFFLAILKNPSDLDIQNKLYKLGDDGNKAMMPQCNLFDQKISKVLQLQKEGDPIEGGLLGIKQALDRINPVTVAKKPITEKVAIFFKKSRLPKIPEIADIIYQRRETVRSTIGGIKIGLLESADMLIEDLEEVKQIYEGMVQAQQLVERDIYFAQLLHSRLLPCLSEEADSIKKNALEDNVAALTQVVNALQSEEAANMIFFANAQNYAKQNQLQLFNIRRRIPLLERSVLANLGLKAGMARLKDTMRATNALTDAVGDTLADAAASGKQMGVELTEARGSAIINLNKLERAITDIEIMYADQAIANQKVIAIGTETSKQLTKLVSRVKDRVEGGHGSMSTNKQ